MYQQLNQQRHKAKPHAKIFLMLLAAFLITLLLSITVLAAEETTTTDATDSNIESSDPDTQVGNADQDREAIDENDDDNTFIPSVQISEDLSVSFPVNI